ncbi:hypothetical protein V1506DRAFT_527498 [Lipomyces tetrasporus]
MKNFLHRGRKPLSSAASSDKDSNTDDSRNNSLSSLSVPPSYRSTGYYTSLSNSDSHASCSNSTGRRYPSAPYSTNPYVCNSYSAFNPYNGIGSLNNSGQYSDVQLRAYSVPTEDQHRHELFAGKRSLSPRGARGPGYTPAPSYHEYDENYDPSIMETENERRARVGDCDDVSAYISDTVYQTQLVEDEEQEVLAIKGQIKHINKETDRTAQNATALANQAYESGTRTLRMLGEQDDMLTSAGIALTQTERHNIAADDNIKEIRTAKRPLFMPNMGNPLSRAPRRKERALNTLAKNERVILESNHNAKYRINNVVDQNSASQGRARIGSPIGSQYEAQRKQEIAQMTEQSSYLFDPDEEDLETERSITSKVDDLSVASKKLNLVARTINMTLERQNQQLECMSKQSDKIHSTLYLQSAQMRDIYTKR